MEKYLNTAISIGKFKEAALYFDHVLPIFRDDEYPIESRGKSEREFYIPDEIIPAKLRNISEFQGDYQAVLSSSLWVENFQRVCLGFSSLFDIDTKEGQSNIFEISREVLNFMKERAVNLNKKNLTENLNLEKNNHSIEFYETSFVVIQFMTTIAIAVYKEGFSIKSLHGLINENAFDKIFSNIDISLIDSISKYNVECFLFYFGHKLKQCPEKKEMEVLDQVCVDMLSNFFVTMDFSFKLNSFLRKYELLNCSFLMPDMSNDFYTVHSNTDTLTSVAISNLNLIDTSNLNWENISDFRKDKLSREKLLKLRNFARANYDGKSLSFIQDDLESKIYDYQCVVKKHGFETRNGALNLLLSSKLLASAAAGSLVSVLLGMNEVAAVSALAGTSLEIGKISLYLEKKKYALVEACNSNPISYIKYIQNKLNK